MGTIIICLILCITLAFGHSDSASNRQNGAFPGTRNYAPTENSNFTVSDDDIIRVYFTDVLPPERNEKRDEDVIQCKSECRYHKFGYIGKKAWIRDIIVKPTASANSDYAPTENSNFTVSGAYVTDDVVTTERNEDYDNGDVIKCSSGNIFYNNLELLTNTSDFALTNFINANKRIKNVLLYSLKTTSGLIATFSKNVINSYYCPVLNSNPFRISPVAIKTLQGI